MNSTPLARAKEAKRKRSIVVSSSVVSSEKTDDLGSTALLIKALHNHHAPGLFLEQIFAAAFVNIFHPLVSSAKVVTFLRFR